MSPTINNSFKILGILLTYPHHEWVSQVNDLKTILATENVIPRSALADLDNLFTYLQTTDEMDLQSMYVDLFDRSRSLSLHLFEHIHGESRDRGQAMVDLLEVYQDAGLEIVEHELPDYLPLFLEYLSRIPMTEAMEMLAEPIHILQALEQRLGERNSPYQTVLRVLIQTAGYQPLAIADTARNPQPEKTIDQEWEDQPVQFLAANKPGTGGCGNSGHCGCSQSMASGAKS